MQIDGSPYARSSTNANKELYSQHSWLFGGKTKKG
jgi:hypothetical protein